MPIKQILLDMDDVLVDCTGACMKHMGLYDYMVERDTPKNAGRDIIKAYREITGVEYTVSCFWEHFKREFWANIPKMGCYDQLLQLCIDTVGVDNVSICTSPTKCGDCLAGKLDWIQQNFHNPRQFIITPRKHLCARPGTLLIDDYRQNVSEFIAAGGMAIAFPRPWNENRNYMTDPMPLIKYKINSLKRYGSLA